MRLVRHETGSGLAEVNKVFKCALLLSLKYKRWICAGHTISLNPPKKLLTNINAQGPRQLTGSAEGLICLARTNVGSKPHTQKKEKKDNKNTAQAPKFDHAQPTFCMWLDEQPCKGTVADRRRGFLSKIPEVRHADRRVENCARSPSCCGRFPLDS